MAFDHEKHELHPDTGFQVDKDSGRHVGVHAVPPARVTEATDYPKWVVPHESHVVRGMSGISSPLFPDIYVDRAGAVAVLVHDADEEATAINAPSTDEAAPEAQ